MVLYLLQNEANQLHSRDNFDVLAIRVLTNDTDSLYDVWNNTRKNNDHHLFRKNTSLVTLSHSWQFVRMKVFIWPELRVIWFSIRSIIRFNISYQWQAPYIQTFEKESHWNKILWERNEIELKKYRTIVFWNHHNSSQKRFTWWRKRLLFYVHLFTHNSCDLSKGWKSNWTNFSHK